MKIKKLFSLLLAAVLTTALVIPASAAESKETVIDLGDGFYLVERITYGPVARAGNSVNGTKDAELYQGSTMIGKATLLGYFDISGSSAKATRAVISGTGYNGWGYKNGTTSLSGNKATGTAVFEMGSSTRSLVLTLTCSPNGTLS
ncbi:MAG: hypothetical protein HFF06_08010 [Oscillospiraceae bacterium]|jgi:hypothetical protein|nr:hypothetical protein [Oscillospiraceae bacterium]